MSRIIEVSDAAYERLETIASARGTTPAAVVEAQAGSLAPAVPHPDRPSAERTTGGVSAVESAVLKLRSVELPHDVYDRIEAEASSTGTTVAEWIAAHSPEPCAATGEHASATSNGDERPAGSGSKHLPRTLAEEFAGRVGLISSGRGDLSQRASELFAKGMVEKRHRGHL